MKFIIEIDLFEAGKRPDQLSGILLMIAADLKGGRTDGVAQCPHGDVFGTWAISEGDPNRD